jgi:hypothetical protein
LPLLRQRVYALCQGYEDLNDHRTLRADPALQTAVERDQALGSEATLCRLENRRPCLWVCRAVPAPRPADSVQPAVDSWG